MGQLEQGRRAGLAQQGPIQVNAAHLPGSQLYVLLPSTLIKLW